MSAIRAFITWTGDLRLQVLEDLGVAHFIDHLEWPALLVHPRTFINLRNLLRYERLLGHTVERDGVKGVRFNDIEVYPSRDVAENRAEVAPPRPEPGEIVWLQPGETPNDALKRTGR